mmetsp:Transcript_41221/g.86078  ORF Transcript_41221/g.86078 Transcript_41221/m.86078 type:complete len:89 (-) Transcript_41221:443-709(-)
MQVTASFNNLMFSFRSDFAVDSACWKLAGSLLEEFVAATCSLLLLTSSASGFGGRKEMQFPGVPGLAGAAGSAAAGASCDRSLLAGAA